jgi:hypothetical protein
MTTALPLPVANFFIAKNRFDIDGMLASFAESAMVRDERRTHAGRPAIRAWMEETTQKYRDTAKLMEVVGEGGSIRVAAQISGDFPGSPVTLQFRFTVAEGQITSLTIGS